MKRIIFQLKILGAGCLTSTLSASMLIYLFICRNNWILIGVAVIIVAIDLNLLRLFLQQAHAVSRAKLIIESHLLHIASAQTNDKSGVDIYFSPFGMLLCDRVVAFEPEKEVLGAVIHKGGIVTVFYGKSGMEKEVNISGFSLSAKELNEFAEKLKHETGIRLMR